MPSAARFTATFNPTHGDSVELGTFDSSEEAFGEIEVHYDELYQSGEEMYDLEARIVPPTFGPAKRTAYTAPGKGEYVITEKLIKL